MKVNIKKLIPDAKVPAYSRNGDAGLDITATSKEEDDRNIVYGTGLAIEIPEGHVGLLFPRSSLTKYDLILGNHVGVVDSNYRGELIFKFKRLQIDDPYKGWKEYEIGDRIGQLLIIPYPQIELVEVDNLSDTERGNSGYGSSGT
jgi:dUTP pyrophosphatase